MGEPLFDELLRFDVEKPAASVTATALCFPTQESLDDYILVIIMNSVETVVNELNLINFLFL